MYRGSLFVSVMGGTIDHLAFFRPELLWSKDGGKRRIPRRFAPRNDNPALEEQVGSYRGKHPWKCWNHQTF